MADVKISALPLASTPLAGTEVLPIVQSATTDQVSVANLTAGRAVSAASLTLTTTPLAVGSGGTGLSTLTAGYIPYGNGTGAFSSNANFLYSSGNLLLGNSTNFTGGSRQALTINGQAGQFGILEFGVAGILTGYIYSNASQTTLNSQLNPLTFENGGTERMRITSNGAVLIGSAISSYSAANRGTFEVYGSTDAIIATRTSSGNGYLYTGSSGVDLWTTVNGYMRFATNNLERMRIDSSGNVGIGLTNPGSYGKLAVSGVSSSAVATFLSSSSGVLASVNIGRTTREYTLATVASGNQFFTGTAAGDNTICYGAGKLFIGTGTIDAGGSMAAVFDASGNLGLGVSPSAWGTGIRTLDIGFGSALTNANSNTATWLSSNAYYTTQWLYKNTSLASYYAQEAGVHKWYNAPSGTANAAISFTQAMTLDASGRLILGGTSVPAFGGTSPICSLYQTSVTKSDTDGGTLVLYGTSAYAVDIGSATTYAFKYDASGSYATAARVRGAKENSTNANYAGYLGFDTRANGGSLTERMRITSAGDVLVTGVGGLGYGTGSGGAVTQATSRTTGVTLNKTNGAITLVSAAGSTTWQSFTVTNSTVAATDTIIVNQDTGTDLYQIFVTNVAAGSFRITFATTGGTTTEQPVFNFAVIKAVTA
jgi:hypothetical protein